METLLDKMKEYLQMDTEIDFAEFTDYYQQVMAFLQEKYDGTSQDELCAAKFILNIVESNAGLRARRKDRNAKKYKKMQEKSLFWSKAINFRLTKEGLTQQEIDARVEEIGKKCEKEGVCD